MKIRFFLVWALLLSFSGYGQQVFSMETFHRGKVSLTNPETEIEGDILYNLPKNTLLVSTKEGQTLSLTSSRVASFSLTDGLNGKKREFFAIPYQTDKGYKRPVFFELLYEDNFALFCREDIVEDQIPVGMNYGVGMVGAPVGYRYVKKEVFSYFLLTDSDQIIALDNDPKKIVEQFPSHRSELSSYIQTQGLDMRKPTDLIRLVRFYNDLKR
jgi:hypothetical protein